MTARNQIADLQKRIEAAVQAGPVSDATASSVPPRRWVPLMIAAVAFAAGALVGWFLRWARERSWSWLLDPWRAAHLAPLNPGALEQKSERTRSERFPRSRLAEVGTRIPVCSWDSRLCGRGP